MFSEVWQGSASLGQMGDARRSRKEWQGFCKGAVSKQGASEARKFSRGPAAAKALVWGDDLGGEGAAPLAGQQALSQMLKEREPLWSNDARSAENIHRTGSCMTSYSRSRLSRFCRHVDRSGGGRRWGGAGFILACCRIPRLSLPGGLQTS